MERRYQVFISSTYVDLKEERAEVTQALLELDCFPAGMELFPATSSNAWDLIKGVIDDSDYYCLIIGGRYGSIDEDGISYTEKEYDYAAATSKPLIAFIHKDPDLIPAGKTERASEGKTKLEAFRKKVESTHHCKYWQSASELGGLVSRSLVNLRKSNPAEGWVRGRFAATDALMLEVANLRARVIELTSELKASAKDGNIKKIEGIAAGTDRYSPSISYHEDEQDKRTYANIETTWDEILRYVGPALLNECSDKEFGDKLKLCFYHAAERQTKLKIDYSSVILPHVVIDQIKIQLRALGHMVAGTKRRAVADKQTYWKLTPLGEDRLVTAQALPRPKEPESPLSTALKAFADITKGISTNQGGDVADDFVSPP